jgi:hypothetical protein
MWGRGEVHTGFWRGDLKAKDLLENSGVDGRIILMWNFEKGDGSWIGLIWLRIGTVDGIL